MKKTSLTLIALTIAGAAIFWGVARERSVAAEPDKAPPPLEVSIYKVEPAQISPQRIYNGRLTANKISQVRPQVSGVIKDRLFEEGSLVKEGDQLYQIDPAQYDIALINAKAQLQKAVASEKAITSKIRRYKELIAADAISQQEFDDAVADQNVARAEIEVAKAAVKSAELNLNYTKVYAPITGKIGYSKVTEGALVTSNQSDELATITQLNPIYADIAVAPSEVTAFANVNNSAEPADNKAQGLSWELVTEDSRNGTVLSGGRFEFSDVVVDESTGLIKARIRFDNPDYTFLPGQFAKVRLVSTAKPALLVPQGMATRGQDGDLYVWVVDGDGKAQKKTFAAKDIHDNSWVVESGLAVGDPIITAGFQKMKPGDAVTVAGTAAQTPKQPETTQQK